MGPKRPARGGGRPGPPRGSPIRPPPGLDRSRLISETDDDTCSVCLNKIHVFAVGLCNHPICSECSARMRVLCQQKECPICRTDMPQVFHTNGRERFENVMGQPFKMIRQYGVCFEGRDIEHAFLTRLEHRCVECEAQPVFKSLQMFDHHMRRIHEQFLCDLCCEHLKIFTHERRCYSRTDLATHRRKGDTDNTSHRGHPKCEYCPNQRFMDKDALFLHLRRDHEYCHFCEADGHQRYYCNYEELRDHFQADHFLCLQCEDTNEKLTNAFRTELDLQAHRVEKHRDNLSKHALRDTRMVDLDFNYGGARDRDRRQGGRGGGGAGGGGGGFNRRGREPSPELVDQLDGPVNPGPYQSPPDFSGESFPTLGGAVSGASARGHSASGSSASRFAQSSGRNVDWRRNRDPTQEDFPSLPGAPTSRPQSSPITGAYHKQRVPTSNGSAKRNVDHFPALGGPTRSNPHFSAPDTSSKVYRNVQPPAWAQENSQASSRPGTGAPKKPAPAPVFENDFPGLSAPVVANGGPKTKKGKNNANKNSAKPQGGASSSASNLKAVADLFAPSPPLETTRRADEDPSSMDANWNEVPSGAKPKKPAKTPSNAIPEKNVIPGMVFEEPSTKAMPIPEKKVPPGMGKPAFKSNNAPVDDFPSLGPAAKGISANFRPNSASHVTPSYYGAAMTPKPARVSSAKAVLEPVNDENAFPSLGPSSRTMTANFRPSRTLTASNGPSWGGPKAPPAQSKKKTGFPPGFNGKVIPFARYQQPPNFKERNNQLLSTVAKVLGGKSLEFKGFKEISSQYRLGKVESKSYYDRCLSLVSMEKFLQFFPELLALLPDIDKQQELLSIHMDKNSEMSIRVVQCQFCRQVMGLQDLEIHESSHAMDSDFPALG